MSSITSPNSVPAASDRVAAIENGTPQFTVRSASSVAPTNPMFPTAKLMTRVDR